MLAPDPEPDLLDHFSVTVDPAAEPADWDDALAEFLITFFCRPSTGPGEEPE